MANLSSLTVGSEKASKKDGHFNFATGCTARILKFERQARELHIVRKEEGEEKNTHST